MRNPTTVEFATEPPKFLFRSDWTLAAGGGDYTKLQVVVTVKGLNIERLTSNIE
jgi:hypothetical protein